MSLGLQTKYVYVFIFDNTSIYIEYVWFFICNFMMKMNKVLIETILQCFISKYSILIRLLTNNRLIWD